MNCSIAWWPTVVALGIACVTDIRSRTIPNALVLPFASLGILCALLHGSGAVWNSLGGASVALVVCGVFCYLRGMGMGDLKLCASIGTWIGPEQLGFALAMTFIAGAAMGILWAFCTGSLSRSLGSTGELLRALAKTGIKPHETIALGNPGSRGIPYAPAIAVGTLLSFFAFQSGV